MIFASSADASTRFRALQTEVIIALQGAGIEIAEPSRLRMDGALCRFNTNGNNRYPFRRNGWAVVFTDGARAVVTGGDWAKGITETLVLGGADKLGAGERKLQRAAIEKARASRTAEIRKKQADAAHEANVLWNNARPVSPDHPYLINKRISPAGARDQSGVLVIPLRDDTGRIHNLQRIHCDGQKRFLAGGRVTELYASIGRVGDHILMCEGWATGKTLHYVTNLPVVVAFSAGNLRSVAEVIRAKYPAARITVCADNDIKLDGSNPGVKAATAAAAAVGGYLAIPPTPGDFNDYYAAHCGIPELTEVIESAANDG